MEIPNGFYRTSIKALILDNKNNFLLCRESNGFWEFPGGGLDFGEKPEDCIKRELLEEMGLTVTKVSQKPSCFLTFVNTHNYWAVNVFFKTEIGKLKIKQSNECVEARFFDKEEALKEKLYPNVIKFIEIYNEK
jgi:8-oxo-dGTP pyrophosphatase MutT (NUDIX family)